MSSWQITSWLYRHFRKLPPFDTILQGENRNLQLLLSEIPSAPRAVIDLGAGHGNAGHIFFQQTTAIPRLYIALDHELKMLKQLNQTSSFSACLAAADKIPLKNKSVNLVLAIGLTEYLANKADLLTEINRIMAPDSYAIITIAPPTPANYLRTLLGHTLHFITSEQFRFLAQKAGFQVVQTTKTWLQVQFLLRKKH